MDMEKDTAQHDAEIQDQFTKQADTFLSRHGNSKDGLLQLMAECAGVGAEDKLLDVACGPGLVSCFFADRAGSVTGLDAVPAMLVRAREVQAARQLLNLEWKLGDVSALPLKDGSFDCVVTRFSFHHFLDPLAALMEMKRVCRAGGTIVVADVTPRVGAQEAFNHWETLRDPSHTRGLTPREMKALGEEAGLELQREESFKLEMGLDDLLRGSFPRPGDGELIWGLFRDDIRSGQDRLGVSARREGGEVRLTYPISVLAWRKRGAF